MRQKRTVRASSVSRRRGVWLGRAIFFSLVRGDYDGPLSISYPRNTHLVPGGVFGACVDHPIPPRTPRVRGWATGHIISTAGLHAPTRPPALPTLVCQG